MQMRRLSAGNGKQKRRPYLWDHLDPADKPTIKEYEEDLSKLACGARETVEAMATQAPWEIFRQIREIAHLLAFATPQITNLRVLKCLIAIRDLADIGESKVPNPYSEQRSA